MSLHPEDPFLFTLKKWVFGFAIPVPLVFFAIISFVTQESYLVHLSGPGALLSPAIGLIAILGGCAFLGVAFVFFGHFFAPYSDRFYHLEHLLQVLGLILFAIGFVGGHFVPILGQ
jgi:hypothetical protein